ncbi:transmembrane protein, putative [Medicago truncatula]|uniref:Transmembrane protein, putative n=1 Tax=Medicago truncatula TaxID=3880 RepID=A0A072UZU7_MEDTR|nr:transmembrane protein, putative [Medicago truncatula]
MGYISKIINCIVSLIPSTIVSFFSLLTQNNIGVSKTPLLRIEDQEVSFFSIVADSTSITLTKSNMSQNQGNVEVNKKEGDDKKKEKSPMTLHEITCDGSIKKKDFKGAGVYHSRLRRSGWTCCFGPQSKTGAPWTVEDNPIDLCDEEDD